MPDETVYPLEELARAVEWYGVRPQTRQIEVWRIKKIAAALREYSRFNAERGDGVWVPREPTAKQIRAIEFAIYRYSDCSARDAERGAPYAYSAMMIAAINPEGNDE